MNKIIPGQLPEILADLTPEAKEQLKRIVIERLRVMPSDLQISIGNEEISTDDLIDHVESNDETGTQMMAMELDFLRDLGSGAVYAYE